MIGINADILNKLYAQPIILNYLRYHPEWYKILYFEPKRFQEFMNEAKETLKISFKDKVHNFQNQVDFLSSIVDYIKK